MEIFQTNVSKLNKPYFSIMAHLYQSIQSSGEDKDDDDDYDDDNDGGIMMTDDSEHLM